MGGRRVGVAFDLSAGRAEGWPNLVAVIEALLLHAFTTEARRIVLLAPDFSRWPLSSPRVLEALQAWGRTGRRLELAAPDWSGCARWHPRLLAWRKAFDHLLDLRQIEPQDLGPDWPLALLAVKGGVVFRVLEFDDGLARWGQDAVDRQAALEQYDAIAQRSGAGWPLSTLGL